MVQTFLANRAVSYLSSELDTRVEIKSLHFKFFDSLVLKGLYVEDQQGDTLLYVQRLRLNLEVFKPRKNLLEFDLIQLDNPVFYLELNSDSAGRSNMDFIVSYFKPDQPDTARTAWDLYSDDFRVNNGHFRLKKLGAEKKPFGVDFENLDVRDIEIAMEKVEFLNDTLYADIKKIALSDTSGFQLKDLAARFKMSSGEMDFKELFLETPNTFINADFAFHYDAFSAFKRFNEEIEMRALFYKSDINFGDISYFAPGLKGFKQRLKLDGKVRGVVSDLKGSQLKVYFGEDSYFLGDVDLVGLPDVESTFINLSVKKLSTYVHDLESIQLPPFEDARYLELPQGFDPMGNMVFGGEFTGFYNDFVAFGNLRTDIGSLGLDLGISRDSESEESKYSGRMVSRQFNFGKFFNIADLGPVTSNVNLRGKGLTLNNLNADVDGAVDELMFRGYSYQDIQLKANLERNLFNGALSLYDRNLSVDFDGLVDLRADTALLDFVSNVYHLDPGALNLLPIEEYSSFTTRLEMKIEATSFDDFKGKADALGTLFCIGTENEREYNFGDISVVSERTDQVSRLSLTSEMADAEITGNFEIKSLPDGFLSVARSVLPALFTDEGKQKAPVNQDFRYSLLIKDFTAVNELIIPAIDFAPQTSLSGSYNASQSAASLLLTSKLFTAAGLEFDDLILKAEKQLDTLQLSVESSRLPLTDSLTFSLLSFDAEIASNLVNSNLFFNDKSQSRSHFPLEAEVLSKNSFDFLIKPSEFFVLDQRWHSDSIASIHLDTNYMYFDELRFRSETRRIEVDGTVSENLDEGLKVLLQNFDISVLNRLTSDNVPSFYGVLNLDAEIASEADGRGINSYVLLSDFKIDEHELGTLGVDAKWNSVDRRLDLDGGLKYRGKENIDLNGVFDPSNEESPLDVNLLFSGFDLTVLNYLIPAGVSDFEGKLNGAAKMQGALKAPEFSGELNLVDAGLKVDYLNTRYYLNDKVVVEPDYVGFNYIPVRDEEGNSGFLVGTLFHENFRNLTYNFYVEMDRMLALNTTIYDNDLFYGKAYASGTADITGYGSNVQIEVTAESKPGTMLYLPLGGPTEVTLERFVSFVSSDEEESVRDELDLSGITLLMDLDVTPDLQMELVFDESLGDVMRVRGSGPINMEISPDGEFTMFGRYEIDQGEYLFTLQNIINKRFSIQKGSVIGWYGDPYNADIDLAAIYKLRASLADLMGEFAEGFTSRVPVNLLLELSGKLLNPSVDFSVQLPTSDESMQNLVNSVLSSEEEKNKQAFSLLVLNRFLPPSNRAAATGAGSVNFGAVTTTEMMSNQLSNWLSQISDDFNVGVNYRPGDNITSEELAVALSTQLLNDRLLLSGSFGVSNNPANISTETNNQVIGDFMAEYLITEDGKLRLKVFSESSDYNIIQTYRTGTVQGAGVAYQEDFDSFGEFACRLRNLLRKKGEKVECDDLYR